MVMVLPLVCIAVFLLPASVSAELEISSVDVETSSVVPGGDFELDIEIVNRGEGDVSGAKVVIDDSPVQAGGHDVIGDSETALPDVGAGDGWSGQTTHTVSGAAAANKTYRIEVLLVENGQVVDRKFVYVASHAPSGGIPIPEFPFAAAAVIGCAVLLVLRRK